MIESMMTRSKNDRVVDPAESSQECDSSEKLTRAWPVSEEGNFTEFDSSENERLPKILRFQHRRENVVLGMTMYQMV